MYTRSAIQSIEVVFYWEREGIVNEAEKKATANGVRTSMLLCSCQLAGWKVLVRFSMSTKHDRHHGN